MYICDECGAVFNEVESIAICYESEYGVASLFSDYHYGSIAVCPVCGSEDVNEIYCDECAHCAYSDECEYYQEENYGKEK